MFFIVLAHAVSTVNKDIAFLSLEMFDYDSATAVMIRSNYEELIPHYPFYGVSFISPGGAKAMVDLYSATFKKLLTKHF